MLGAFAQYFSDNLAKHVTKGIDERVHRGLPAGPFPFGYRRGDGGAPEPVPGEAQAIREAFRMRAAGRPYAEIAAWLNAQGFRTRNTHRSTGPDGSNETGPRPFTVASARFLLSSPFYVGRFKYRGETWPGNYEPLVEEALYDLAQGRRSDRIHSPTHHRAYLLAGLARCAECGLPLWCETSGRADIAYYRQQTGSRECSQGGKAVPCATIDAQIDEVVTSLHLEPPWRDTVIERVVALSERERVASEGRNVEERLKRLGRALVDGLITERPYEAERRQLRERLSSLVVPEVDVATKAGALLEQIQELWREATLEERHKLLSGMVEAIYVDLARRQVVGLTPRAPFRHAFAALSPCEGRAALLPPDVEKGGSDSSPPWTGWWRRGRIELPVQRNDVLSLLQAYPAVGSRRPGPC